MVQSEQFGSSTTICPHPTWRERLALRVLECLASSLGPENAIRKVLQIIVEEIGIKCAGLRLRSGDDYPYFVYHGYSGEFLRLENSLCTTLPDGSAQLADDGRLELACICGRVIRGRTLPELGCFTEGGSFFTPAVSELVASPHLPALGAMRKQCAVEGFETLCLVPLKHGGEIVGLIHLGDPTPHFLRREDIPFLERLGKSVGVILDRRQAAARVEQTEKIYQQLFAELKLGFAVHRPMFDAAGALTDYVTLQVNRAFETVPSLQGVASVGKRASEILPPEELSTWLSVFDGVVRRGTAATYDVHSPGADKQFSGYAFAPRTGRIAVLYQDVTQQRRTDSAVHAHRRRLLRMNECLVSLGANFTENVNRITALSGELLDADLAKYCRIDGEAACSITRWNKPENDAPPHETGEHYCSLALSQQQRGARVVQNLPSVAVTGGNPASHAQGFQTYMGAAVFIDDAPVGVLSLLFREDVSPAQGDRLMLETFAAALAVEERRHRAAEEVRAQEASLRALFENMRDGFVLHETVTDEDGGVLDCRFVAANHAFERQFDLQFSDLMGRSTKECLPDLHDALIARYAEILNTGGPQSFEFRAEPGGRDLAIAAYRPTAKHLACVITDITEQRCGEAERAQMLEALHEARRTEAISTLAGGVAHDFNNLLAGLLGCLSLMELNVEPESVLANDIAEMKASVERGADLTMQLLGFSRQGKYEVQPVDLNQLVRKTLRVFSSTRKDLTLKVTLAGNLASVLADAGQLDQVLLNLLVNAGQSMENGGTLTVKTQDVILSMADAAERDVSPGPFVLLSVEDIGVGMDPAIMTRIFEPFFSTKKASGGTGLGLASVQGIVTNHRGFVTVESSPGQGSTFHVGLPACDQAVPPDGPRPQRHRRGHETILLVDDEDHVRRSIGRLLESLGYTVLPARDGVEALEIYQKHPPPIHLVILDMVMPRMSGRETFIALRTLDPRVKLLLSSGYSLEGQARELLGQGEVGFLQKPYTTATLSAKLRELL